MLSHSWPDAHLAGPASASALRGRQGGDANRSVALVAICATRSVREARPAFVIARVPERPPAS